MVFTFTWCILFDKILHTLVNPSKLVNLNRNQTWHFITSLPEFLPTNMLQKRNQSDACFILKWLNWKRSEIDSSAAAWSAFDLKYGVVIGRSFLQFEVLWEFSQHPVINISWSNWQVNWWPQFIVLTTLIKKAIGVYQMLSRIHHLHSWITLIWLIIEGGPNF